MPIFIRFVDVQMVSAVLAIDQKQSVIFSLNFLKVKHAACNSMKLGSTIAWA